MSGNNTEYPVYRSPWFELTTSTTSREELLEEIGKLHMQAAKREAVIVPLERLSLWIKKQAIVSTPQVCCPGMELESRIVEIIARENILRAEDK